MAVLRDDDSESASAVAQVEAGVLASIISCDGRWCRVSIGGFRGYIEQTKLWGAYQGEVIKYAQRHGAAASRSRQVASARMTYAYFLTSRTTTSMWEILRCSGRLRQAVDADRAAGNIDQLPSASRKK